MEDLRTTTVVLDDLGSLRSEVIGASTDDLQELRAAYASIARDVQDRLRIVLDALDEREAEERRAALQELLANPDDEAVLRSDPSYVEDVFRHNNVVEQPAYQQVTRYNGSELHDAQNVRRMTTLPRTQTSVLVKFDGLSTFTLHIPKSPEEADTVRVVEFSFNATDDVERFASLLGSDISVPGTRNGTIGKNVKSGREYDAFDTFVPLALDLVDINGKRAFRIPEVVWRVFGNYALSA